MTGQNIFGTKRDMRQSAVAQSPHLSKIALTHDAFSRHVANWYRHLPESGAALTVPDDRAADLVMTKLRHYLADRRSADALASSPDGLHFLTQDRRDAE
jgi:hypothetical protein